MKTKLYDAVQYVSLTDIDSKHLDELCEHYKMNRPTLLRELLRHTYKKYCLKTKKKNEEIVEEDAKRRALF